MAKDWDYAKFTHKAKEAGGPEKYLEIIKNHSFSEGRKRQAIIDGLIILCATVALFLSRIFLLFKSKKTSDRQTDDAERELISKMNEVLEQEKDIENENIKEGGEDNA